MLSKSKIYLLITIFILIIFCDYGRLYATITGVTLTAIDPPTTLSNGHAYYLAGVDYSFRVQAVSDNTVAGDWGTISLYIREGATTRASCVVDIATATVSGVPSNMTVTDIDDNSGGIYSNIDFTITVRPNWNNGNDFAEGTNSVRVVVTDDDGSSVPDVLPLAFGLATRIDIYNFQADGVAADGKINAYHTGFNVTGDSVIYYVEDAVKAGAADTVESKAESGTAEISDMELVYDAAATSFSPALTDADTDDPLSFTVPAGSFGTILAGDHTLRVRATMATSGGPVVSLTTRGILLNVNYIDVTNITYINGGGVDSPFYRSVNLPGTEIRLTAVIHNVSGSVTDNTMKGNTTFTIQCRNNVNADVGGTFTVTISDGDTIGTATIPHPDNAGVELPDYTTGRYYYVVTGISGGAYDNDQNTSGEISQTAVDLFWDNNDPPGETDGVAPGTGNTDFTTCTYDSNTAVSLTISWTPLDHNPPCYDGDFYSYRIYFKKSSDTVWSMLDRTVDGYGLNVGDTYNLGSITQNTAVIDGLDPFTSYDYYLTAIDVFGQEVDTSVSGLWDAAHGGGAADDYDTRMTDPTTVSVSITDGITRYDDAYFQTAAELAATFPDATLRPLRKSAIRIDIFWASSQGEPDGVYVVLGNYIYGAADGPANDLFSLGSLTPAVIDRIKCSKTAPNTWTAYIPSERTYLVTSAQLKFIVESVDSGFSSFVDHDEDFAGMAGDTNNWEWTFSVANPPDFKPWPTRMLNNVITDDNPRTYPSYYLTDNAYVTITAYDIKGRPVAVLLENAWRPKGQNIKEDGWAATNKNKKKLGVGLYYVRIRAKRASDGKILIDKFSKIVVAK